MTYEFGFRNSTLLPVVDESLFPTKVGCGGRVRNEVASWRIGQNPRRLKRCKNGRSSPPFLMEYASLVCKDA